MENTRLLLVDDEAALTGLLKRYLERLGYAVDACESAAAAIQKASQDPGRYALVITDLTLPQVDGEELVDQLHQSQPGLPVIITSGYPHQPRKKGVEFLQKPFLPRALAETIERLLAKREG